MIEDPDPFQLHRFVQAQEGAFEIALSELRTGRKQSHWMWFVFPQHAGLGRSPTAQYYGIRSIREARAYLADPLLGERYRECVQALLTWTGQKSAPELFGEIDALKLRSSLTLFQIASGDPLFLQVLNAFYDGPDAVTVKLIGRS